MLLSINQYFYYKNHLMKKLLLTLSVLSLLLISACGDDDDGGNPEVGLSGTITFDGESYSIANGFFSQSSTAVGIEGEFFLADGTVSSTGSSSDSQIIIGLRAISEGTSSLESGSYEVNKQVNSKYAFVTISTTSDSNIQSVQGGTIDISGSGNTFSLTFNDVAFGQGRELSGSVNGTFEN